VAALDAFVLVGVVGLVALEVVPGTIELAGWTAAMAAALGLLTPMIVERVFGARAHRNTHRAVLPIALIGVAVHAFLDGSALAGASNPTHVGGESLGLAIVLHRLSEGVAVWWLVRPSGGRAAASLALGFVAAATVSGFVFANATPHVGEGIPSALFQAFVAGLLLHVVGHAADPRVGTGKNGRIAAGLGGLIGLVFLTGLVLSGSAEHDAVATSLHALAAFALESAPALLFAYVLAGLIHAMLPMTSTMWLRRGGALARAGKGVAFGLPLPVCSCGVVPIYRSLVVRGVPIAAAMAFVVATPELGIDSVMLSIPLLGTEMALMRVVAAVTVAVVTGYIVGGIVDKQPRRATESDVSDHQPALSMSQRVRTGLRIGLTDVVDDTAAWISVGLLLAAVLTPSIDPHTLATIPAFVQVPLFALVGMPAYVCASGATPLVAVLLHAGISPGAAIAFLLTGPGTNVTTFGVLASLHGKRVAWLFACTIAGTSIAMGWIVNALVGSSLVPPPLRPMDEHRGVFTMVSAVLVAGLFLTSFFRLGPRGFLARLWTVEDDESQEEEHVHPHLHESDPGGSHACSHG